MKQLQVDVVPDSIVVALTGMQSLGDVEAEAISIRFDKGSQVFITRSVGLLDTVAVARLQIAGTQIRRKTRVPCQQLVGRHLIGERNV